MPATPPSGGELGGVVKSSSIYKNKMLPYNNNFTQNHTHTQSFNGLFSRTTCEVRYQKDKPFWIFWSRDDGVAVASVGPHASLCTSLQTDNHVSTSSLRFLRAGCSSWHPTNRVKALKAKGNSYYYSAQKLMPILTSHREWNADLTELHFVWM